MTTKEIFKTYYSERENMGFTESLGRNLFFTNEHLTSDNGMIYVRMISPQSKGDRPKIIWTKILN